MWGCWVSLSMRAAVYSVGLLGKSQYEGGCLQCGVAR